MNCLVVGAGRMGRWLARVIDADVAFADVDPAAADAAAAAVGGRSVPTDTDDSFDAVCLAVPIPAVPDAVDAYADNAERALFDVSGAMEAPVAAMRAAAPDRERASLHPLFAPENAPGNVAAVVDAEGPTVAAVLEAVDAAGNDVFETTPEEHDEAMATVQAGAHAAVLAYGLAAADVRDEFATPISERLTELLAQVTAGNPRVYADIQATFPGADAVADAARKVADADAEEFVELFEAAGEGTTPPDGGLGGEN